MVPETKMVTDMFASLENNDLASLKQFLDEGGDGIDGYVNSIEYRYNVAPQIFDANTEDGAVSYTHLDVYKRQGSSDPMPICPSSGAPFWATTTSKAAAIASR